MIKYWMTDRFISFYFFICIGHPIYGGDRLVEKVACEIKCVETANGFRIEVTGERAKKYIEKLEKGEISCFPICGCC